MNSEALRDALALALEWAGPRRVAVLLSGSHAAGEGVWVQVDGARVSLSDLDVYAVMEDDAACREAAARARAAEPGLAARMLALGFAAPLEVGFWTREGFAELGARPATLDLRRHARLVDGDAAMLERIPQYAPRDVSAEEITLLLENRAFELLAARESLVASAALERLRARHALLKAALDLAGVAALAMGEYPDGAEARVAMARSRAPWPAAREDLDALWDAALAWRRGEVHALEPRAAVAEWERVVRAWRTVWWERTGASDAGTEADPYRRAVRFAARARARRRVRHAIAFPTRSGLGPGAWSRWRFAARGTPQHRLNASASILLLAADAEAPSSRLPAAARAALARLGAVRLGRDAEWSTAAARTLGAWDRWMLDGRRFPGVS